jgi:HD superfamily phosphodiesterase
LEYIYNKGRGKILIHENINFDKDIYDLETPIEKQRTVNGKVINRLNTKIMPQEVLLMTQRLPQESLATK